MNKDIKHQVISSLKNGKNVKEISDEFKLSPTEIYEYIKEDLDNDKNLTFEELPLSTRIKILMMYEKYEEAILLCDKEENINNVNIHEQEVKVLMLLYEKNKDKEIITKAVEICDRFKNVKNFNKLKNKILSYVDINVSVTRLLTNIYYDTISKEEIENCSVTDWEKSLLLISYYEKHNKKTGLNYIKEIKNKYKEDKEKIKTLNILTERLNGKKNKLFNPEIYCEFLNCTIDANLVIKKDETEKTIETVKKVTIPTTNKQIGFEKNVIKNSKTNIVDNKENKQNIANTKYNRYNRHNSQQIKKEIKETTQKKENKLLIKDIFKYEVIEIGKQIYIEMNNINNQANAVKAWDNFYNLINKPIDNDKAMNRMIEILNKFRLSGVIEASDNYDKNKILAKNIK